MLWVLAIPLALNSPTGQIEMNGMTDPPLAYADKGECEAVPNYVSQTQGRKIECKGIKIVGGKHAESF